MDEFEAGVMAWQITQEPGWHAEMHVNERAIWTVEAWQDERLRAITLRYPAEWPSLRDELREQARIEASQLEPPKTA